MVDSDRCLVNRIFKILSFGLGRVIAAQSLTSSPMKFSKLVEVVSFSPMHIVAPFSSYDHTYNLLDAGYSSQQQQRDYLYFCVCVNVCVLSVFFSL